MEEVACDAAQCYRDAGWRLESCDGANDVFAEQFADMVDAQTRNEIFKILAGRKHCSAVTGSGRLADEVAKPTAPRAAAPPVVLGHTRAQLEHPHGVLEDPEHVSPDDPVLDERVHRLDVRLVADVAAAPFVGADADLADARIVADVGLQRLQLHHARAPAGVRRRQEVVESLQVVVEVAPLLRRVIGVAR